MKSNNTDSLFEAVFKQAVIDNHNEEISNIASESELSKTHTFSVEYEKRMKKLFKNNIKANISFKNYFAKIVACVAIVCLVSFGLLMTSQNVQAAVVETVIEWFDKFTKFTFRNDSNINIEVGYWSPDYLPQEYSEFHASYENIAMILYKNPFDDEINFSYSSKIGSLATNNENVEYTTITGDSTVYYIFSATTDDFDNIVVWECEDLRFSITSRLSVEEILKIVFSVTKKYF